MAKRNVKVENPRKTAVVKARMVEAVACELRRWERLAGRAPRSVRTLRTQTCPGEPVQSGFSLNDFWHSGLPSKITRL